MADDPNAGASLEELFGPDVLCACEEFESLDGPWAYFVSLLEFLPTAARAELKKRRSDLWNLRFAKGNAETSDRYLSLALEILENAAIDRQQELAKQATPAWPTNQTTWTEDQLVPSPEHPNPAAY